MRRPLLTSLLVLAAVLAPVVGAHAQRTGITADAVLRRASDMTCTKPGLTWINTTTNQKKYCDANLNVVVENSAASGINGGFSGPEGTCGALTPAAGVDLFCPSSASGPTGKTGWLANEGNTGWRQAFLFVQTANVGQLFMPSITWPQTVATGGVVIGANNQIRCMDVTVPFAITLRQVAIEVTTNVAASHTAVAIYSTDGNTKIADSGALDSSTTGAKTASFTAVVLSPGTYTYCVTSDAATVQVRNFSVTSAAVVANALATPRLFTAANSSTAGVFPATLGARSAVALTSFAFSMWSP